MARFVVVTPVLNAAAFVRDSLASVAAQSEGDWVHYLVDGGSVDGTMDILEQAADQEPRRRIIRGKDRSLYDAWFKALERAQNDGVTDSRTICVWLGADDLLMPWAFATLMRQFDETGAEWIAALPSIWDREGRLEIVQPFNWYPRRLIRAGQFHNRSLGTIQNESVYFTQGLFAKVPKDVLEDIRLRKAAGDFLLWREFARYADLIPISTVVAGFRSHGSNISAVHKDVYFKEISESGVRLPPVWLGRILRACFRQVALLRAGAEFRNSWRRSESRM